MMKEREKLSGGIDEATYGGFRGFVNWNDDRDGPLDLELRVNGVSTARAKPEGGRFAFESTRATLPSDQVEIVAYDRNGCRMGVFRWGEIDRRLPASWMDGGHCRYPSFFVLGAAKSGTTSLHLYLEQHPAICMSNPKEPFFFEAEYERGPAFYYNKYFGGWKGEAAVGESRHRNLYLPYVPERIHQYNPKAKLITILRNPAERAISHWWHWHSINLEPLSPAAAFQADLDRIEEGKSIVTPEDIRRYVATLGPNAQGEHRTYLDSSYYAEQLERYLRWFSRDQLLVILLDELIANLPDVIRRIFQFLEIDETLAEWIEPRRWNESQPGMWAHIDDGVWRWLIDHYRPHNHRLEELLGRSLKFWDNTSRPRA